jgi:hypothetical protein
MCKNDPGATRQKRVAAIPGWYSPWAHLSLNVGGVLAVAAVALSRLRHPLPRQWLDIPVMILIANAAEWQIHFVLMHRFWGFNRALYDRHVRKHHRFFTGEDMSVREWRELYFVLMHPADLLALLLGVLAFCAVWAGLTSSNGGLLAVATICGYIAFYEVSHLVSHWPVTERARFLVKLRRHHATHHQAHLMARRNFNVVLPLADAAFRTSQIRPQGLSE